MESYVKNLILIILAFGIIFITYFYYKASEDAKKLKQIEENKKIDEGENEKKQSIHEVLSKIKTPKKYSLIKEEQLDNKSRKITVIRNYDDLAIKVEDNSYFYTIDYIRKNGKEQICFSFVTIGCDDASILKKERFKHLANIINEEQETFIKKSLPIIKLLEDRKALRIDGIKETEKCVNYSYSYSYSMLPLNDLRTLGLEKLNTEELKKVYKEAVCVKDNIIMAFYRNNIDEKGFWEIKNLSFEAKEFDFINESDFIGVYNYWFLFLQKISEKNIDDPQIRSIAVEFSNPKICFMAKNIDECLLIYAERLKTNASCYYLNNQSLKEKCFEYILNITKKE